MSAKALCRIAAALALCALHAQAFPAKPVRLMVPFPPGGSTDMYARLIGRELTASWG